MSLEESSEERQRNEFDVLKSIYNEDLIDLRDKTTSGWVPLNMSLRLGPLHSSSGGQEAYAKINLNIRCPKNYPAEVPQISLKERRGLSDAKVNELLNELLELCVKLKGEEMIYELAQHVQEFLHKHNARPQGSFYEQMMSRQKLREENKQYENKIQEDQKRQVLQDEILKRKEILKTEERLRHDSRISESSLSMDNSPSSESYESFSQVPTISECQLHRSSKELTFPNKQNIIRGCCMGHSKQNFITYIALDLATGEPLCLKEYTINIRGTLTAGGRRYRNNQQGGGSTLNHINELQSNIELQLGKLIELRHSNLVPYESYLCQTDENSITIYLLQPFIFSKRVHVDARSLAEASLKALSYLHRNDVPHGNLVENSIMVDSAGQIRLTDFGFQLVTGTSDVTMDPQIDLQNVGELLKKQAHSENDPQLWDLIKICQSADKYTSAEALLQHQYVSPGDNPNQLYYQSPKCIIVQPPQEGKPAPFDCFPISDKSRILSEFTEVMKIGKGAFGDVLKVRNNLDGCEYAIKKIPLNPRNRQLYGKITREVKLLSKLYHENVVRYYNSWIETAIIENVEDSYTPNTISVTDEKSWSVTHEARQSKKTSRILEDDSDSDSDDYNKFLNDTNSSSSGFIHFEDSKYSKVGASGDEIKEEENTEEELVEKVPFKRELQYMYIQMEFCEKSTLRTAIDDGLGTNSDRCWRLFREIVEGLAHIHQQGMIHRDLKPVNIFIDSRDHVKIGDFGLATTSVMVRSNESSRINQIKESNSSVGGGSLTGQVGTALYVAPELVQAGHKANYNEKVDIYSLGIILFEMIYPFVSMMERAKVLQNIRLPTITMPSDVDEKCGKQIPLVRWLLNHDASSRPSSAELLVSDLVPPVRLEDRDLFEMVRTTLDNPKGKAYKHLVARCLEQRIDPALDLTYHVDLANKNQAAYSSIKEIIVQIFRKHGAVEYPTPLLTPLNSGSDIPDSAVRLMTHSGCVVTLPVDLRATFARHAALSDIRCVRRFAASHVYSERRVFGFHPRQSQECVMDVLIPGSAAQDSGGMLVMLDAEMMSVAADVTSRFPLLQQLRGLRLQLNHPGLLQAALAYCSVPRDKRQQFFSLLDDYRDDKISKFRVQMFLNSIGTGATNLNLLDLLDSETLIGNDSRSISCGNGVLSVLMRGRGETGRGAKESVTQIETAARLARILGVQCPMYICPGLRVGGSRGCRPAGGGGVLWRMVCEGSHRRGAAPSCVLAAGARYDDTLHDMRQRYCTSQSGAAERVAAAGLQISPDRILQAVTCAESPPLKALDAAVTAHDPHLSRDVAQILCRLWNSGLRACPVSGAVGGACLPGQEEALEQARELRAHCLITPCGGGEARVRMCDAERFQEKKLSLSDVCEYVMRSIGPDANSESGTAGGGGGGGGYSASAGVAGQEQAGPQVNILIVTNEKAHASQRRRYEHQTRCHMSEALQRLNSRCKLQILCVSLQSQVMSLLADKVHDADGESALEEAVIETIEQYPKSKKYLMEIGKEITAIRSDSKPPIIAFYSLISSTYRILL